MLRLLVSPRWIAWHVLTLGAMVACGFLSAWQWHRAGSAMGSALNVGYGVQWPIFAVFFGFMWWHFLRMELRGLHVPAAPAVEGAADDRSPGERVSGDVPAGPGLPLAEEPDAAPVTVAPEAGDRSSPFTPRPAGVEPSRLSDPQIRAYNRALAELATRDQES